MGNTAVSKRLGGLMKYTEAWLAVLLFVILAMLVIPTSPHIIDFLIAINITFAVVILMTSMYITKALEFSVFPAMLLVTTMLRVALSIASVRNILSDTPKLYKEAGGGEEGIEAATLAAGHVVKAFGDFVVQGNPVIGLVIFIIVTVAQFVVVSSGAGRVAEVAARFTLDAMPGKQMAIDAEYNARVITPEEAQARRAEVTDESNFFGAMDGAMKFVKGDTMVGILIILVAIIGGFIVGIMNGMPAGHAARTFVVMTVGEGLISQIASLLVAISAGLIVTRSASPRNMGSELGKQLTQSPRALGLSAGIIGVLGLVPGMPHIPLLTIAALVGAAAYFMGKRTAAALMTDPDLVGGEEAPEEINAQMLRVDPISLEVGNDLAQLADPDVDGELLERLKQVRKRIAMEFGVIAPGVRVRPHPGLAPGGYQIRIKGDLVAEGDVMVGFLLGIGRELDIPGLEAEPTVDPIYNTPALWVRREQAQLAEQHDLQLFDSQDVVSTHVAEVIKQHLDELLTREEVMELINMARQEAPNVVNELIPNLLTLGQVRQVLQNLVREQVPIKDLPSILNSLADSSYQTKDVYQLTEFVRTTLGRKICQRYQTPEGTIRAFLFSGDLERRLKEARQYNESGQYLALDPDSSQRLHNNLAEALQMHRGAILDPVIVCPPELRRVTKKLFERTFTKLVVLSFSEIVPGVQVENLATIEA